MDISINLYFFISQIVAEADIPSLTTETVWDYFVEVIVPVIEKYQAEHPLQKGSSLGHVLVHFAESMQSQYRNSEVSKYSVITK